MFAKARLVPTCRHREFIDERHGQVRAERPVRRTLGWTMWPPIGEIHDPRERKLHDEDRSCGSDPRIPD
jgi:hypothetical protein